MKFKDLHIFFVFMLLILPLSKTQKKKKLYLHLMHDYLYFPKQVFQWVETW